jgi:hypothetical protein
MVRGGEREKKDKTRVTSNRREEPRSKDRREQRGENKEKRTKRREGQTSNEKRKMDSREEKDKNNNDEATSAEWQCSHSAPPGAMPRRRAKRWPSSTHSRATTCRKPSSVRSRGCSSSAARLHTCAGSDERKKHRTRQEGGSNKIERKHQQEQHWKRQRKGETTNTNERVREAEASEKRDLRGAVPAVGAVVGHEGGTVLSLATSSPEDTEAHHERLATGPGATRAAVRHSRPSPRITAGRLEERNEKAGSAA